MYAYLQEARRLLREIRTYIPGRIGVPGDARYRLLMQAVGKWLENDGQLDKPSTIDHVPPRVKVDLEAWAADARPVGQFLEAVLSNDLRGAIDRADPEHLYALPAIMTFVCSRMPIGSYGSISNVRTWPGFVGMLKAAAEASHGGN